MISQAVIFDMGNGLMVNLKRQAGLLMNLMCLVSLGTGIDVILFSGDACSRSSGLIIAGRRKIHEKMKKHPPGHRALRVDKMTFSDE